MVTVAGNPNEVLQQLLAACARRDQSAFAELYRITSAKLFAVSLRILKREDWAEEILQDSFVNIWNHAEDYRADLAAPMTWMTSVVRNRSLDWVRRPQMEVPDEDDVHASMAESPEPGPYEKLVLSSQAKAVGNCLARLDGNMRQAVTLAFFEGLSHGELAEHMRQPLGTVKTWVRRGLERLKTCLAL